MTIVHSITTRGTLKCGGQGGEGVAVTTDCSGVTCQACRNGRVRVTDTRPDLAAIRARLGTATRVFQTIAGPVTVPNSEWAADAPAEIVALLAEVERLTAVVAEVRALVAQRDERGATWVVRRVSALTSDGE